MLLLLLNYIGQKKRVSREVLGKNERGHQNMFETMSSVMAMVIVGGLKYPMVAAAMSIAYSAGNYFYQSGYSDVKKDVKGARYTHPLAALKPIGTVGSLVVCILACIAMLSSEEPLLVATTPSVVEAAAAAPEATMQADQ